MGLGNPDNSVDLPDIPVPPIPVIRELVPIDSLVWAFMLTVSLSRLARTAVVPFLVDRPPATDDISLDLFSTP